MKLTLDADQRRFMKKTFVFAGLSLVLCGGFAQWFMSHWKIGFDASPQTCLPWRFYVADLSPPDLTTLQRGELVTFKARHLPPLPENMNVVKFVAGLPGDTVTIRHDRLYVNGQYLGDLPLLFSLHNNPDALDKEFTVPAHHLFLVGTNPASYDSRYWGVLDGSQIESRVHIIG